MSGKTTDILTKSDYYQLFDEDNGIIVDVRNGNHSDGKRLDKAVHVDIMSGNFVEFFNDIDRNRPVLVYCDNGSRSKIAIRVLSELGFEKLYHMTNGVLEWEH
jgi:rhodanese-related sulfurtransferase